MNWTYNLHGRPDSPVVVLTAAKDEEPGHLLVIERKEEPGVCDGYIIRLQNHDTLTAEYDWIAVGSPELVMQSVLGKLSEAGNLQ